LDIYVLNKPYVETEMLRAGVSLMPYLVVGFVIMVFCSCVSVMLRAAHMQQNNVYKVTLFRYSLKNSCIEKI
jgi:hypothetical protein